jgi:hypothetical protein
VAEGVGLAVVVGLLVGVGVAVGELLAVADGLDFAWLAGVAEGWLGVGEGWLAAGVGVRGAVGAGEGVSVLGAEGRLVATAAPAPVDGAAVAIMIPATRATMPPTAPTASSSRVQEEIGSVPCPSSANGSASLGLDWHQRHPVRRPRPGRRILRKSTGIMSALSAGDGTVIRHIG